MINYQSILANEMNGFLEYYNSLGRDVRGYITVFNQLDRMLVDQSVPSKCLTKETAEAFSNSFSVRPYCHHNYISHYNIFVRYLNSLGIYAFELELPKLKSDYTPYIFTDNEWMRIIEATDNLNRPNLYGQYKKRPLW